MKTSRFATPACFMSAALLWGLSAIISKDQALAGSPELSVGIRMTIVSIVMFIFCRLKGIGLFPPRRVIPTIVLQGSLFFSLGFIFFYYSTLYIPSGVSAILLSISAVVAAVASAAFFSQPLSRQKTVGVLLGIAGLAILFKPQVSVAMNEQLNGTGLLLGCAAACATGLGTVFGGKNQSLGTPVPLCMAWGAAIGASMSFLIAFVHRDEISIILSVKYFLGLGYLSLLGSCLAFFLYFKLVERIGAGAAASILATVPLIAVAVSVIFENLPLNQHLFLGGAVILVGNLLVLVEGLPFAVRGGAQGPAPSRNTDPSFKKGSSFQQRSKYEHRFER